MIQDCTCLLENRNFLNPNEHDLKSRAEGVIGLFYWRIKHLKENYSTRVFNIS